MHNPLVTWQGGWAQGLSGFGDPQGWDGGIDPKEWRWERSQIWGDPEKVKEGSRGPVGRGRLWTQEPEGSGLLGAGGTQRPPADESTGVCQRWGGVRGGGGGPGSQRRRGLGWGP